MPFAKTPGKPDPPILYVQIGRLVTTEKANEAGWEKVRELQRQATTLRPNLYVVPRRRLAHDGSHSRVAGGPRPPGETPS